MVRVWVPRRIPILSLSDQILTGFAYGGLKLGHKLGIDLCARREKAIQES